VLAGPVWSRELAAFSASPVTDGTLVYLVTPTGELHALAPETGETVWTVSVGTDQLHASPAVLGDRLVVPMRDGTVHVVAAGREGGRILSTVRLDGLALGAPAVAGERLIVGTTEGVTAFRVPAGPVPGPAEDAREILSAQAAVSARVVPAEVLLRPGERVPLTLELLDGAGRVVGTAPATSAEPFIPPTAKVRTQMDASFVDGALVAARNASLSAGAWRVRAGAFEGITRGRVVVGVPYVEDFEDTPLDAGSDEAQFAGPSTVS
jgi:FOG: WD40-like repeat